MNVTNIYFDDGFDAMEQLPRNFTVNFDSIIVSGKQKARISINGIQVGDSIDDNSSEEDFYRFHDVFHYTFATFLGWSPCTRVLMKRKRKSSPNIDDLEDGARAIITEEAISLLIFNQAKQKDFFEDGHSISPELLSQIKEITTPFEVSCRSEEEWKKAIDIGYFLFRELAKNNGGRVHFDMLEQKAIYEK